jgi:hypothetical protein
VIRGEAGKGGTIDANVTQYYPPIRIDPVERQHRHPRWKRARGCTRPKPSVERVDRTASSAPLIQIAHQQYRMGLALFRPARSSKCRHQPVRLLASFDRVQTKMGRNDPQHSFADQNIRINRSARFVAGNCQIDRPRCKHRKPGQDRVAEPAARLADANAYNDPAAGGCSKISPLVGVPFVPAGGLHLLQARNVGIDLPQHPTDTTRIATPVNTDASMNIIGNNSDRWRPSRTCNGIARPHSLPDLNYAGIVKHSTNVCCIVLLYFSTPADISRLSVRILIV